MAESTKNTTTRLLLPEYGRNVQKMVQYLRTIEDREERNKQAEVVAAIMGNIYPYKRDSEEFQNMLWDHLFMIADFDLDIDSPFEKPTAEQFSVKPQQIKYPTKLMDKKQYGRLASKMIKNIAKEPNQSEEDIELVASNIAKFLKQKSHDYNNEYPDNQRIIDDIHRISGGEINLAADTLDNTQITIVRSQKNYKKQQNRKK